MVFGCGVGRKGRYVPFCPPLAESRYCNRRVADRCLDGIFGVVDGPRTPGGDISCIRGFELSRARTFTPAKTPRAPTALNILLFAKIPARKNHFRAVTFVASGKTGKCGPDRVGRRGDGGNDRDRCLSREGERRFRSYPIYLSTSIKNS